MKPILFNTEMVRAILDGKKTQTRRINKDGGEYSMPDMSLFDAERRSYGVHHYQASGYGFRDKVACVEAPVPICPGDVLYVRETWAPGATFATEGKTFYRADDDYGDNILHWHPSIHMPREAARIFLRVTDVRVERLQDITNADCVSEGAVKRPNITKRGDLVLHNRYRKEFGELWDTTIKPAELDRYGWAANPWVWVYTFERYDPADPEGGENNG